MENQYFFFSSNVRSEVVAQKLKQARKADKKTIKRLEAELRGKDQALARDSSCRLHRACQEVGISVRTYQRWTHGGEVSGIVARRHRAPSLLTN